MKPNLFRPRNVFAIVLIAGTCAMLAFAHNKLMKTEPAAGAVLKTSPAHVEMWFAEKPDAAVTKIAVKGPAGAVDVAPVHAGSENAVMADIKGMLADGQYTVSWQTAGDDGHVSKGDFGFSVHVGH
jgi:methionine-rich copper-binding protein CopC